MLDFGGEMASAQVVSGSSRKQELLAAGKRRLEEFRKQKAAGKKAVAPKQSRTTDSTLAEKQASENGEAPDNSAGPASYGMTDGIMGSSENLDHPGKEHDISDDRISEPVPQAEVNLQSVKPVPQMEVNLQSGIFNSPDLLQTYQRQWKIQNAAPEVGNQSNFADAQITDKISGSFETSLGEESDGVAISSYRSSGLQDDNSHNSHTYFYGDHKNVPSSEGLVTDLVHQNHVSDSVDLNRGSQAPTLDFDHNQHSLLFGKSRLRSDANDRRPNDAFGNSLAIGSQWPSEPISRGFDSNINSSVNGILSSGAADMYPRKSRPSFLDSLNIGRVSPATGRSFSEKESFSTSKFSNSNFVVSSWSQYSSGTSAPVEPLPNPVYPNNSDDLLGDGFGEQRMLSSFESKLDFSSKRNEDFDALEQHIEDLTQEKFSLQRAMEASKALAESLAAENSSLTESYNQQASIVNQLKAEMDRLQGDIKARLVELEAIKAEYMNAQLECSAADERAKLLASEVISLEEKALRLRSSELKLERELENSNAEIASYKKKLSSLDKERRDFQHTIDALQEEKKLLQSKLRKASTSGISVDMNRGHAKKDVSTSTHDLRHSSNQASNNMQNDDTDNLLLHLQDRTAAFEDLAAIVPPDQVQMIQNINSLMTEIMSEKEEMMQALINEASTSAKLKDLNKELSYKLEVQTQRLELLTAQSMAAENIPAEQPTISHIIERERVAYADEGDEVVERVLGWIMKLFPGGPSKRRTSRL